MSKRTAYMSHRDKSETTSIRQKLSALRLKFGKQSVQQPIPDLTGVDFGMQTNTRLKPFHRLKGAAAPLFDLGVTRECA